MLVKTIDKNRRKDLSEIYEIFRAAYNVEAQILNILAINFFPLQMTLEDLEKSSDEIFALEVGKTLVGAIFLEKSNTSITISNLVIDPKYFRQGFGKALVSHVLEKYRSIDFLVGTGYKNTPAIKLYKKFDFQIISEEVVEQNLKIVKLKRLACEQ